MTLAQAIASAPAKMNNYQSNSADTPTLDRKKWFDLFAVAMTTKLSFSIGNWRGRLEETERQHKWEPNGKNLDTEAFLRYM